MEKTKTKEKAKSGLVVMIITLVYYTLLIILGLVGYLTEAFAGIAETFDVSKEAVKFGFTPEEANLAYAQTYSFLLLVMASSIFYYFATQKQIKIPKPVRVILFILGIGAAIGLTIVYMGICNRFAPIFTAASYTFPTSDFILRLSVIVGDIGFIIFYLFSVLISSPESVRNKIIRGTARVVKSNVFGLLITVALTVFLVPLAFVLIMIVVILIALFFFAVMTGGGGGSKKDSSKVPTFLVNENGYTRELQFYDYYNGVKRYRDDLGHYWYSEDEKTFYKE
ncbi:MAG: hypothetical protein K2G44_03380 [Clostridia bacterium]|nr:hypothetical protein [Clostridia bacterium]